MKSLAELAAIRDKMKDKVALRLGANSTRIVVGMGTCGIAAGAKEVLNAFIEEINAAGLAENVMVTQTGCLELCQCEPVVEIYSPDAEKVTYVNMTTEKVKKVVEEHIKGGKVVAEYSK